ncbi:MAG: glycosyltransferase family 4 protein [Armatimonadota bacterium]|nr:glycosyltransferase family 4 protein [bacterium]
MKVWIVTIGEPVPVEEQSRDILQRAGQLACFLAEHGHDVMWWTSTFDHFRKKHLFDKDTEIRPSEHLRIRLLRGTGYRRNISYARIRDQRIIAAKFAKQASADKEQPDVIVASLPVIELCEESVKYGKNRKVPVVLDMHDMWPDICVDTMPAPVRPIVRLLLSPMFAQTRRACAEATAIIGMTDAFVDWGLSRAGRSKGYLDRSFPFGKSLYHQNLDQVRTAEEFWDSQAIYADSNEFIICFFGAIGYHFDLESPIQAVRILENEGHKIRLVICGTGDRLEHYKSVAKDVKSVVFPGWMNAAQINVLMKRSSLGLDPMPDRYDFLASINNKALEYMSAGLPVVSCPKAGVLYDVLKEHQCGMSYDYGDTCGLASILRDLMLDPDKRKMLSENSAQLFQSKFTAESVYGEMMAYLSEVVDKPKKSL